MRALIQWMVAFFWIAVFNGIALVALGAFQHPEMSLPVMVFDIYILLGTALVANGERR